MRGSLLPAAGTSTDPDGVRKPGLRVLFFAAALTIVALLAAGCGGGGSNSAAAGTTTTPTTGNRAAQTQAFLSCMQSHGVKITSTRGLGAGGGGGAAAGDTGSAPPSSTPGVTRPPATLPPGVTQAQYDAALQACRSLLPARGNLQNNPAFRAYRNCINLQLTQHGAPTLPATGPGSNGGGFGGGQQSGNTTTTNPALQAAQAHCANLLPAGGFGGPRSSTTSTT